MNIFYFESSWSSWVNVISVYDYVCVSLFHIIIFLSLMRQRMVYYIKNSCTTHWFGSQEFYTRFTLWGRLASYFLFQCHNKLKKWSPNFHCQNHRKCKRTSAENMNTIVGCKGPRIGPDLHPNIVHFQVVMLTPSSRKKNPNNTLD